MNIIRWATTAFAGVLLLAGCASSPQRIANMSEASVRRVADADLCEAVNSSTRSDTVVAEVERRALGCDTIFSHCSKRGLDRASPEFASCVADIEQRWETLRRERDKVAMEREMRRQGDPMRIQREMNRVVCRTVTLANGTTQTICTPQ